MPAVFVHYLCVYAGLSVLGTLRHSKIFCHECFSTSVHTHVEEEKSHVSTCDAAQVSESHENEALSDDRDVVLQQPKEPKTISTLCQASKSTHRTMESGGSSALNREDTSSCVWPGLHACELHGQHVHRCRNWGRHRGHALRFHKGGQMVCGPNRVIDLSRVCDRLIGNKMAEFSLVVEAPEVVS